MEGGTYEGEIALHSTTEVDAQEAPGEKHERDRHDGQSSVSSAAIISPGVFNSALVELSSDLIRTTPQQDSSGDVNGREKLFASAETELRYWASMSSSQSSSRFGNLAITPFYANLPAPAARDMIEGLFRGLSEGHAALSQYEISHQWGLRLADEEVERLQRTFFWLRQSRFRQRQRYVEQLRRQPFVSDESVQNATALSATPSSRAQLTGEVIEALFDLTDITHNGLRCYEEKHLNGVNIPPNEALALQRQSKLLRTAMSERRQLYYTQLLPLLEVPDAASEGDANAESPGTPMHSSVSLLQHDKFQ